MTVSRPAASGRTDRLVECARNGDPASDRAFCTNLVTTAASASDSRSSKGQAELGSMNAKQNCSSRHA